MARSNRATVAAGANGVAADSPPAHARWVTHWDGATQAQRPDMLASEEPLEVFLAARPLTVTMRTPGHDEELVAGLLYTQGMLREPADLGEIQPDPESPNHVDVALSTTLDSEERWRRYTYASSSCGICGVESIDALVLSHPPVESDVSVSVTMLYGLDAMLRGAQIGFGATGGTHAAAIFTASGELLAVREDVGRHNAVDKVIGYALLHGLLPLERHVLMVSGRISYEIVQKALVARVPIVAAVSAPTSLAVRVAAERGITLAGFLRGAHVNVYSHPERIVAS